VGAQEPINLNPNLLCKVWTMSDDHTKDQLVAGAYDQMQAVTIAAAWFNAYETIRPDTHMLVGVYDSSDQLIAQIGTIK